MTAQAFNLSDLSAANAAVWVDHNQIQLQSGPFSFDNHQYQIDWLTCDHPRQSFKKGAQIGATETLVIKTLHHQLHGRFPQGCMYLFPTADDVTDFSKARFQPLISNNPCISDHVQSTDAANIKNIAGSMLYLRGARATKVHGGTKKSSSKLKSAPVDALRFDERDEMDPAMVRLARERFSHSMVQEEISLSTPTIPDWGIDAEYQVSDQRVWMIRCGKCGKETCLETEFPGCLHRTADGKVVRLCVHCRDRVLNPTDGRWVAQKPSVVDHVGWWISQLCSIYVDPTTILDEFENPAAGGLSELYNSKLGQAYIETENRLTPNDVLGCCSTDAMATRHDGPCGMGVDVGSMLHVTIGHKRGNSGIKIVKIARVSSFNDLHDLAKLYSVRCAILDLMPETRKVREFRETEQYPVFGCSYNEYQKGSYAWDERDGLVSVNRTEICDTTHDLVTTPGRLELPRQSAEVLEYSREMSQIAKVLEENAETGSRVYRYRKLGADHYRHSTNYLVLALEKLPAPRMHSMSAKKVEYVW